MNKIFNSIICDEIKMYAKPKSVEHVPETNTNFAE
jgi:hypothetical protein